MHRVRSVLIASIFSLLPFLGAGCDKGPAIAPVSGVVTQDGKPLPDAVVEFQPDYGTPSYATTTDDGAYELSYRSGRMGALLGHHTVRVSTRGEVTDPETDETYVVPETIPGEYNSETTLEFEVERGKNVFDIPIKGKRKPGRYNGL